VSLIGCRSEKFPMIFETLGRIALAAGTVQVPRKKPVLAAGALLCCVMPLSEAVAQTRWEDLPPCSIGNEPIREIKMISTPTSLQRQVEVGGTIFSTEPAAISEAGLRLDKEYSFTGRYAGAEFIVTIPPLTLDKSRRTSINAYAVPEASFRYTRDKSERHGLSKPNIAIFSFGDGRFKAYLSFGFILRDFDIPAPSYEPIECIRPAPHAVRTEIHYGGAAKGVISLQYREFADNLARPAFSQDATFDLAEGNEIAFKGMHMKVLGTSNAGIKYVITSAPASGS
jgi:hypothetical protein